MNPLIDLSTLQEKIIQIQVDTIIAVIDVPGGGSKLKIDGRKTHIRVRESMETVQERIRKVLSGSI